MRCHGVMDLLNKCLFVFDILSILYARNYIVKKQRKGILILMKCVFFAEDYFLKIH